MYVVVLSYPEVVRLLTEDEGQDAVQPVVAAVVVLAKRVRTGSWCLRQ